MKERTGWAESLLNISAVAAMTFFALTLFGGMGFAIAWAIMEFLP